MEIFEEVWVVDEKDGFGLYFVEKGQRGFRSTTQTWEQYSGSREGPVWDLYIVSD